MLQFQITKITFPKASKYKNKLQKFIKYKKRTDVCFQWTSSPTFQQNIQFLQEQTQQTFKIKACEATIDRKIKIIGFSVVQKRYFQQQNIDQNGNEILFNNDLQLIQVIQGKDITIGRCHLQIKRKNTQSKKNIKSPERINQLNKSKANDGAKSLHVSLVNQKEHSLANSKVFNSARLPIQQNINFTRVQEMKSQSSRLHHQPEQQEVEIDSDLQIKSNDDQEKQNDCSIKFFIHGGTNFYLGSSFSVQLIWGQKYCQTRYIKDKIMPQWAQSLSLIGHSQQSVTINIIDQKHNILEWTKISLQNIRKIYPYHLKIIFRQEYMGDRPIVYLSLMRQDLPKFSILDKQLKLVVNYEGQNLRNPLQYLLIQSKTQFQLPHFFEIDLRKYSFFDQVNKYIESFQIGDYNWANFIPLETGKRSLTMFKSQLNRSLSLFLISVKNWSLLFSDQNNEKKSSSVSIIQKRQSFQEILKQIYYHQEVHAVGKITQIYSQNNLEQGTIKQGNTWRTMTKNYILRNNLLNNSIKNLEILKNQIQNKGEELIKLKKILNEVKTINITLKEKQKSTLVADFKNRKQRLQGENFKITDIQMMLYEKQAELDFKKKRNDQMSLRMDSLNVMQEDTTQVDQSIVQNSKIILEQQQKIKLLKLMRKQIPKQKQLIGNLQSIFQKKQLDRQMNDLLKKQSQKLTNIRKTKRADLQKVYNLLKQKNSHQNSLKNRVQAAETQLIKLNQFYAKLTGL